MASKDWHILTQIIKAGEGLDHSNVRTPGVPIFQTSVKFKHRILKIWH